VLSELKNHDKCTYGKLVEKKYFNVRPAWQLANSLHLINQTVARAYFTKFSALHKRVKEARTLPSLHWGPGRTSTVGGLVGNPPPPEAGNVTINFLQFLSHFYNKRTSVYQSILLFDHRQLAIFDL